MWRRVVWQNITKDLEELTAFVITVEEFFLACNAVLSYMNFMQKTASTILIFDVSPCSLVQIFRDNLLHLYDTV
jgi:hypothetical protein